MVAPTLTVEDVINEIGIGALQWIGGGIFCGMSFASAGIQQINLSLVIQQFSDDQQVPLNANQLGILNSIVFMGMIFGTIPIGVVADKYGRRIANIIANSICLIFGVMQGVSINYVWMLACRFLTGVGAGAIATMVYLTTGELAPTKYRAILAGVLNFNCAFQQTLFCLLTVVVIPKFGWQGFVLLTNIPTLIGLLGTIFYVPESPHYYMSIHKVDKAQHVLKYIARANKSYNKLLKVNLEDLKSNDSNLSDEFITKSESGSNEGGAFSMFHKPYLVTSCCIMFVWFASSFSQSLVGQWLPTIFSDYSFAASINQYWQTSIVFGIQVPGVILSIFIVELLGRKTWLIVFLSVNGVSLLLIMINPNNGLLVMAAITTSLLMLAIMANPLSLITVESFPTKIRGSANAFIFFLATIGASVGTYLTPELMAINRLLVLVAPAIIYFITASAVIPLKETRGQQLKENITIEQVQKSEKQVKEEYKQPLLV